MFSLDYLAGCSLFLVRCMRICGFVLRAIVTLYAALEAWGLTKH
jgi:hypothetical protein